jgi:hypothetical protein
VTIRLNAEVYYIPGSKKWSLLSDTGPAQAKMENRKTAIDVSSALPSFHF